LGPRSHCHGA